MLNKKVIWNNQTQNLPNFSCSRKDPQNLKQMRYVHAHYLKVEKRMSRVSTLILKKTYTMQHQKVNKKNLHLNSSDFTLFLITQY